MFQVCFPHHKRWIFMHNFVILSIISWLREKSAVNLTRTVSNIFIIWFQRTCVVHFFPCVVRWNEKVNRDKLSISSMVCSMSWTDLVCTMYTPLVCKLPLPIKSVGKKSFQHALDDRQHVIKWCHSETSWEWIN